MASELSFVVAASSTGNTAVILNPDNPAQAYDTSANDGTFVTLDHTAAAQQTTLTAPGTSWGTDERQVATAPSNLPSGRTYTVLYFDSSDNPLGSNTYTKPGTLNTLDAVDTALDTRHTQTQDTLTSLTSSVGVITTRIGTPAGASIAADIAAVDTAVDSVVGAAQSRINYAPSVTLTVSNRNDGTYTANKAVRLVAGSFDTDKAVGLDMSSYFGKNVQPASVGTPVVSSGSITCTALGPRDELAMVQLGGTATAGENPTVTVPVTMDNGDQITVAFEIEVGSV